MYRILAPAALAAAIFAAVALAAPPDHSNATVTLDAEEQAFMTLLNNYRVANGKLPLIVDPNIQAAAEWMSADMGANAYFSHCDAYGNGAQQSPCPNPCVAPACRSPWTRMCDFGYCYNTYKGENIAAGYVTAQSVFDGWQSSPGHNANMLGDNYRVMGLARVYTAGSPYGYYWTNDFGGYIPNPTPPPSPTSTPSPAPTPPPTPVATPTPTSNPSACGADSDCDGWTDAQEMMIGTDSLAACNTTTAMNDETPDAWPPDLNDDTTVSITDVLTFSGKFGLSQGQPGYSARWELAPSGTINIADVLALKPNFPDTCG